VSPTPPPEITLQFSTDFQTLVFLLRGTLIDLCHVTRVAEFLRGLEDGDGDGGGEQAVFRAVAYWVRSPGTKSWSVLRGEHPTLAGALAEAEAGAEALFAKGRVEAQSRVLSLLSRETAARAEALIFMPLPKAPAQHMHPLTVRPPAELSSLSSRGAACSHCQRWMTSAVGFSLTCRTCNLFHLCSQCAIKGASDMGVLNSDGAVAHPDGGHFYCGRDVTRAGYHTALGCAGCSGVCRRGPTGGCNCVACHALDGMLGGGHALGPGCWPKRRV
jgi:hypothetical protein